MVKEDHFQDKLVSVNFLVEDDQNVDAIFSH